MVISKTKKNEENELIFVYNVESGIINLIKDYFHLMLKPQTYECNLCAVISTPIGIKSQWKKYYKKIPINSIFLLKDKFLERFNINETEYPCVYIKLGTELKKIIENNELNRINSVDELITLVDDKLERYNYQSIH